MLPGWHGPGLDCCLDVGCGLAGLSRCSPGYTRACCLKVGTALLQAARIPPPPPPPPRGVIFSSRVKPQYALSDAQSAPCWKLAHPPRRHLGRASSPGPCSIMCAYMEFESFDSIPFQAVDCKKANFLLLALLLQ